ncbi:hypothetical protein G9A89_016859 [Geosiphon pyriformis]|nr:hypothetical protein G9A89_016859 [Geosiphon pyriformis]
MADAHFCSEFLLQQAIISTVVDFLAAFLEWLICISSWIWNEVTFYFLKEALASIMASGKKLG